jgi:WD40 repeat protein
LKIERIDTFAGHRGAVYALAKGMDVHAFYSAGADGWVVQWNLQKPDLGRVLAQIQGSVYAMRLDRVSGILWVCQNNEGIHGIHLETLERVFSIPMLNQSIYDIQFWEDQVWVAGSGGLITVFDRLSHQVIKHIKSGDSNVRCLLISGNCLFAGYSDGFIRIFNTSFELIHGQEVHKQSVFSLVMSGDQLISVGRDAHIRSWTWDSDGLHAFLPGVPAHIQAINALELSPCGRYLATGSMDKTIKIWHASDLTLIKVIDYARYGSHKHSINALIWSEYSDLLVSGSDDKQLSVWKID